MKKNKIIIAFFCIQVILESLCFSQINKDLQKEFVIYDFVHNYDLNPHTAMYTSEAQILTGLYEGLLSYDPVTLAPVCELCESYKISRDKKRWKFILKENLKFSNGDPITAQSVKDSWIKLLSTPDAPFASFLDCIENAENFRNKKCKAEDVGIEVRNERTLVLYLVRPGSELENLLCHYSLSVVHSDPKVFSGPFELVSYENNILQLKKNSNYHDAEKVYLPTIKVVQNADVEQNAFAFNNGQAQWCCGNANSSSIVNKDSLHVNARFGTSFLFFKTQNSPWNNPAFREALLEAIPYDTLRKPYSVKAKTLVYPLSGYPEVQGLADGDAEDALYLMKSARKKADIPQDKKLNLVFGVSDWDTMTDWVEMLKNAWEPLGVELSTQQVLVDVYNNSIKNWNADLFYYSWIGDYADPLAMLELFRSNSSLNPGNYSNPQFDELLDEAAKCVGFEERYKILSRAEQMLLDDFMIIPIYHPVSYDVINMNEIGGWFINALDIHPLKYLYFKENEVKIKNLVMR